jgi:hypothetical protein
VIWLLRADPRKSGVAALAVCLRQEGSDPQFYLFLLFKEMRGDEQWLQGEGKFCV